jgi:AraC family transcriptional regulator of adaptative response/methylated-DNA-[protein]-cysteine methyltransferase
MILKMSVDNFGNKMLNTSVILTPLGSMLAGADLHFLYFLKFVDHAPFEYEIAKLQQKIKTKIIPGRTSVIDLVEKELDQYFAGQLQAFKTPVKNFGSPFQQMVWSELQKIPYGHTWSYTQLATAISKPQACRAVAQANGANQFAIIIPCHRVINLNGELGGYNGGIDRKKWLLDLERTA